VLTRDDLEAGQDPALVPAHRVTPFLPTWQGSG
jgi:hypothetical protein